MLLSERNKRQGRWELFKSNNLVETVHKAKDMGWADKKVQVRSMQIGPTKFEYTIEPFEKDCGCASIMKYDDYFTPLIEEE